MLRSVAYALTVGIIFAASAVAFDFYQLHMWGKCAAHSDIAWAISVFVHAMLGHLIGSRCGN
jgi:hypothetical protein